MTTQGVTLRSLKTELIWANHRDVEPTYQRMRFSVRDETSCWYVDRGAIRIQAPGGKVEVNAGRWLYPGQGDSEVTFTPGSRIISIRFRFLYPEGGYVYGQMKPLVVESDPLHRSARVLVKAVEPCRTPGTLLLGRERMTLPENLDLESRFYAWLGLYCRSMQDGGYAPRPRVKQDERVTRALELFERHSMREPFTEADLASACGIGPRQLRRLMEQETGQSPYGMYDERRQDLACHALRETSMPMKEIAYELGFKAPSHFSNWFRKRIGTTPRTFRRTERERVAT